MGVIRVATMNDPASTGGTGGDQLFTPLDALQVMGSSDVMVTPTLRHVEMYTMRGLLTHILKRYRSEELPVLADVLERFVRAADDFVASLDSN